MTNLKAKFLIGATSYLRPVLPGHGNTTICGLQIDNRTGKLHYRDKMRLKYSNSDADPKLFMRVGNLKC